MQLKFAVNSNLLEAPLKESDKMILGKLMRVDNEMMWKSNMIGIEEKEILKLIVFNNSISTFIELPEQWLD